MTKVLIIEDDPLMSRMYQKIFTFEKFEVEVADNGKDGLAKASVVNPTIILLDVMMPQMNGLEVLDNLKSNEATKKIPVIMLTNLAGQQDAEAALSKGAVKYIIKSEHEPKEVADMVNEVIAGYTRNEIPQTATVSSSPVVQAPAQDSSSPVSAATVEPVEQQIVQNTQQNTNDPAAGTVTQPTQPVDVPTSSGLQPGA